jgi:hypothetical protein
MTTKLKKILTIAAVLLMCLSLASCGKSASTETEDVEDQDQEIEIIEQEDDEYVDPDDPTTKNYENGITFEEEVEGAQIVTAKKSAEDFVGDWEATSGQSLYQYGNVDITVNENGTWTGNIATDDLEGSWTEDGDGLSMTSEYFDFQLVFTDNDVLVMKYWPDEDDNDYIATVLTRKK